MENGKFEIFKSWKMKKIKNTRKQSWFKPKNENLKIKKLKTEKHSNYITINEFVVFNAGANYNIYKNYDYKNQSQTPW